MIAGYFVEGGIKTVERDDIKRSKIEDKIIAKIKEIQKSAKPDREVFVDLDRLLEFMDECYELHQYYKEHVDTVIGVEIISVYLDFTKYFNELTLHSRTNVSQSAREWLTELERWMNDIITAAAVNWEYLNRNNSGKEQSNT